jgi:hypothetical protein
MASKVDGSEILPGKISERATKPREYSATARVIKGQSERFSLERPRLAFSAVGPALEKSIGQVIKSND